MINFKSLVDWKLFGILFAGGVLGTLLVFPYVLDQQADVLAEVPLPLPVVLLLSLIQTSVILLITIFVGLIVSRRVGLRMPLLEGIASGTLQRADVIKALRGAVPAGVFVGLAIIAADWMFALLSGPIEATAPPFWQGAMASFYGGITEEILMRLFLMSVFVWVAGFVWKSEDGSPSVGAFWIAIFLSAFLFGIGHLPATAALVEITPIIVLRAIILNGIGGVVFGWLFWRRGLGYAMIAHFSTDIVLHVVLPIILKL